MKVVSSTLGDDFDSFKFSVVAFGHGSKASLVDNISSIENPVSRSYIQKYSKSWQSFAEANDITKREKLKKALKDALHSIDFNRQNEVASAIVTTNTVERIKKAATLLKEFKQIHALSDTVKRTLQNYNAAKRNLSQTIASEDNLTMLKKFLVARTKRSSIAGYINKTAANAATLTNTSDNVLDNLKIDKPHFIKHTPRVSLIATPIDDHKAIGVEYISIDPKTSTIDRAKNALKAARILLKYAGKKRKSKSEHLDYLIDSMRKDLDGAHQWREDNSDEKKKKSLFPNKANLFLNKEQAVKSNQTESGVGSPETKYKEAQMDPDTFPAPADNVASENNAAKREHNAANLVKPDLHSNTTRIISQKDSGTLGNDSNATIQGISHQQKSSNGVLQENEKTQLNHTITTTNKDNIDNTKANTLIQEERIPLKQEETLRRLKEAKLARQRYELARHELAQKVKELYNMANEYEKEETENQVLEVKNDVVPKIKSLTPEPDTHGVQTKRDDAHPGIALAGVSNHVVKKIETSEPNDGTHKGFTMGAIDKKEHQISLDQTGVPTNVKLDALLQHPSESRAKSQEETLQVIAQAIKEDLNGITNTDKKKKILAAAMANTGAKKNSQANEKIDEYLTKALADIMGTDSVPASEAGKEAEMKQKEREDKQASTLKENMKIVEEAMKTHAAHPDLPLPLVSTSGDKMVLNKDPKAATTSSQQDGDPQNRNGVEQKNDDHKAIPPLNLGDPSSKALLDQASHMEEQVAAQQDQLYNKESAEMKSPQEAKPNIDPSPPHAPAPAYKSSSGRHDPYGSIKETHDNPNPPPMEPESEEQEDDGDEGMY